MKVFIVTKEAFPNGMAATNRIKCYARAIKEGGLECQVIICGCTELNAHKIKNNIAVGNYEGVPFRYIGGTTTDTRPEIIRKFFQFVKLIKTGLYLKKNMQKGDVLLLFMGGQVKRMLRYMEIAHSKGAFCVRDLCELPYGTSIETEKTIQLRKITIESQFPKLDGIISISDTLLNLARTYTLPTCRHIKVPIMVDYDDYFLTDKSSEVEIPYIFHSGTLYEQKDGFVGMLEAFGKATSMLMTPIRFISTGNIKNARGKERSAIQEIIRRYNLEDKVSFLGYVTDEELKNYLSKATLVIINKYRTQQNNYCFSTKLGEYMAAAKPVVITNVGEAMNWLKDGENAYVVEPEDNDALANTIVRVFSNPEVAYNIGKSGQKLCKTCFDYKVWSKPLVDFFNQLKE